MRSRTPRHARIGLDARLASVVPGGIATYIRAIGSRTAGMDPSRAHIHFVRRGIRRALSPAAGHVACWTPPHHRLERVAFAAELLPHRLDLLHGPDFVAPAAGFRHLVLSIHDLTFLKHPALLRPDALRHYRRTALSARRADAVVVDADAVKRDVVELLGIPAARIVTIPLGRNEACAAVSAETRAAVLARLGLVPGYLLCVGTFEPRKNLPGLLDAYADLVRRLPDAPRLVLAGFPGPHGKTVRARAAADPALASRVILLSGTADADLPALHAGASAFVLLSHDEGFALPVVDAMSAGVPLVLSRRGALPEVGAGAALFADLDEPASASAALERVLTDATLARSLGAAGRQQAARFSWDETARRTLALYDEVLG